jgi:hypothetical protein
MLNAVKPNPGHGSIGSEAHKSGLQTAGYEKYVEE